MNSIVTSEAKLENNAQGTYKDIVVGLTTVLLILSLSTVVLSIATEYAGDAATGVATFKLTGQAHVNVWVQKTE